MFDNHCGFRLLSKILCFDEDHTFFIDIEQQNNGFDCCYRCMYNSYMHALDSCEYPTKDYFDITKFNIFVELIFNYNQTIIPRVTVEQCQDFISKLPPYSDDAMEMC